MLAPGQRQGGIPGQLEYARMIAAPDHVVNMLDIRSDNPRKVQQLLSYC